MPLRSPPGKRGGRGHASFKRHVHVRLSPSAEEACPLDQSALGEGDAGAIADDQTGNLARQARFYNERLRVARERLQRAQGE